MFATEAQAAGYGGHLLSKGERLLDSMARLMDGHQPAASLLHGDLYNLYHILNHLILFGEAYLQRSENIINKLLAKIR